MKLIDKGTRDLQYNSQVKEEKSGESGRYAAVNGEIVVAKKQGSTCQVTITDTMVLIVVVFWVTGVTWLLLFWVLE